jgi:hypothetical protein
VTVAHCLILTPKRVAGTAVGGCSFMIHVRHAAAAIAAGLCETVLITHGERGPLPASGAPAMSSRRRASPATPSLPSPASGGGLGWRLADGVADFVHDPGIGAT